ncbi:2,3-bisphosphoglycerate-independent phosphoglycerate mutase [Sulfurisphaera tokodaii]|uniref:2,3-bisphosphoglycerate-independent phosphoglycerate mutase n=2 Tax=Sulfurisphaera tokodaii TaxID=111955 RepID=APGM_SULTO|nr:2,3-bisphosphoglycerate-independent phosphoglycerate mutase [Sulfurisphaera tokodaii]Q975P3.1 RecName: Full=2,3-bisphosphoglycerate-independent phosphoglycerate mutase; Short=BPG-independent PGAM; Short=Phosphoglyceromutase; Short=aPGAM [Sulfurisphaera tokodaii str. 7]BAB65357.1 2,3-bisphosphoglycerate-independent phosphoglycerate mutase [Sulfurisphaera tokodaii str. 7]HII74944.1 2,3-bisphosphoglycerate-independent phosphoglycerate mutase [Sulfurisphaera tokodaii]
MKQYKILFFIADGLGDRPVRKLQGKTPLEYVDKPNIRELLKNSIIGLMDPISPGVVAGSDTSHLSMFGLDPHKYYRGRGAFEAIGAGARLKASDVAFRGNFATVNNEFIVVDRRAGRKIEEADDLVKELNEKIGEIDGVKVRFYHGTEHRVAVVLSGKGLTDKVSDTDPHEVNKKVLESKPLDNSPESQFTANIINKLTRKIYEILNSSEINKIRVSKGELPANIILLRGAAEFVELPQFESYTKLKAAAVSATALIKGICEQIGMRVVTPPGATGGLDTNYLGKADAAVELLKEYDFVFLHLKATDAASHDGNVDGKVYAINKMDEMIGRILDKLGSELVIAISGDHTTPVEVKEHTGDPVPFLLYVPYDIINDVVNDFNEREARRGSLRIRGLDVINLLLNYSNRAEKYGA